ncbi:hypothetical protein GOV12_00430 [Candidatus Pacearchaeota archaeon]|nr:hypothetical protein [Candidatus Pacearchaeota archaeon]
MTSNIQDLGKYLQREYGGTKTVMRSESNNAMADFIINGTSFNDPESLLGIVQDFYEGRGFKRTEGGDEDLGGLEFRDRDGKHIQVVVSYFPKFGKIIGSEDNLPA